MSLQFFVDVLLLLALAALCVSLRGRLLATCSTAERLDAAQALRHADLLNLLVDLQNRLEAAEQRQLQRNSAQLADALHGVISDFHQRIVAGFETQLANLAALAAGTAEITSRHRKEQMEAMHHARRLADKMDLATSEFGKLLADNSELLALAGQVRDTLSLLGARQDSLDSDILRQAESVEAMGAAMRELRSGFEQAAEHLLLQTRRSLDAMAQRQAQGNGVLQKELNDSLNKAIAGMSKQLSVMAPMTQQAKIQTFR